MRPPQFAGESRGGAPAGQAHRGGFNEAPAVRGGKFVPLHKFGREYEGFNEAPAVRGGKSERDPIAAGDAWMLQ